MIIEPSTPRVLPRLNDRNRAFWTGGAAGQLQVPYCPSCERWTLPLTTQCPRCGGETEPRPVQGTGTVFSWTVNEQPFHPEVAPPYNIVIVTLDEGEDLRLISNLVDGDDDDIEIGMPVEVVFEAHGEIHVPLFRPC